MWARVGVLSALALVLSYIETFIPLPITIPGIKLGLANVVVLMAFALLPGKGAWCVALIKVLAAGFLFGNPVMMLYSAAGTIAACCVMALLMRIPNASVVLVAVFAAMAHNAGQLFVASVMLGTQLVWVNAPFLAVTACVTGVLSGVCAQYAITCAKGAV